MLTYWKCRECHGTGRVFRPWYAKESQPCFKCDGSGNALVDGEEQRHRRRLAGETANELKAATAFGGR